MLLALPNPMDANMSDKMTAKIQLRKQLNLALKSLGKEEKTRQSKIITQKVLENNLFREAKTVSVYLNMNDEVQTEELLHHIFKQGKECFIPRFQFGQSEMEMIKLLTMQDYYNLPVNKWNIKQPPSDQTAESVFDKGELDLVLTPGLAFTLNGDRLGRGKGYYDKFFEKCKNELKRFPYLIGLAFNEQILEALPMAEFDVRLDIVYSAEK